MLASWPEASCNSPRQLALPKFIITTPIASVERVTYLYYQMVPSKLVLIVACSPPDPPMSPDMILLDWCDTGHPLESKCYG